MRNLQKTLLGMIVMLLMLATTASAQDSVIKMTTTNNIGSWITLNIEADGELTYVGLTPYEDFEGYYQSTAKEFEIHGKVKRLECSYNHLSSLDVSGDPYLIELLCDDNYELANLTIGENPYIYRLYCGNNSLTSLDITGLTGLQDLSCYKNQLTTLDLSKNTELTEIVCRENLMTGVLDLSNCPKVEQVSCYQNKLTGINLSATNGLRHMEMERNDVTGAAMTELMNALPAYQAYSSDEWDDWYGLNLQGLYITESDRTEEHNMPLESDVKIATDKGWPVYSMNIAEYGEVAPTLFAGYSTGISSIKAESATVELIGKNICVSGAPQNSSVALLSTDGKLVAKQVADAHGNINFHADGLPVGIYVVKGNGFYTKIFVK